MKQLSGFSLLLVALSASATEWPCSVHPPKGTPESAFPSLTKVTQADAQTAALAGFAGGAASATIADSELELEHGCLIYSFDIRVAGQQGVDEVIVDAGTGKVLSRKHESSEQEAAETKQEAAEATARASKPASSQ